MTPKPSSQGNVPDAEIQTPGEFQYYVQRNGIRYDYTKPRTPLQLQNDVNVLHSFTKKLLIEKDRMQRTLRDQRIWTRVLTAAVVAQFAIVIELLKIVLERMK